MSNDRNQTTFRAGAFLSEDAVRGALERRRRDRPANNAPASGRTQLRRWSVAELIARAVPRPPAGGVAH
jgi:hypothetical protein